MVKKILIEKADRLYQMAPELTDFARILPRQPLLRRAKLIDLANLQWPITRTPDSSLTQADLSAATAAQIEGLKEELMAWLERHFHVRLASVKEVYVGADVPSLLFALTMSLVDQGDPAFVPGVGLPHYRRVIAACGGEPIPYLISAKTDWRPQLDRLAGQLTRIAPLFILNSPHDPTGAELNEKDLSRLVWSAAKENFLIVNDASHQSIPDRKPISLLAVEGGKRAGVELYSFSQVLGLPSMPFGFAVGSRQALEGLRAVKSLFPVQLPVYLVEFARQAIKEYPNQYLRSVRQLLGENHAEARTLMSLLNLEATSSSTVPFLWARIHRRTHSATLARLLYRRYRILAVPGSSMGELGEGYMRFSLTAGATAYKEAAARVSRRLNLLTIGDHDE